IAGQYGVSTAGPFGAQNAQSAPATPLGAPWPLLNPPGGSAQQSAPLGNAMAAEAVASPSGEALLSAPSLSEGLLGNMWGNQLTPGIQVASNDWPIGGPSSNLYAAATGETTQLPSD